MKPKARQDRGTIIAKMLWPALGLNAERSFWDLYGQDGELDGKTIQIKYDHSIARTGNLYHEVYEKSALNDSQQWRKSPGVADAYVLCTEDETTWIGYYVPINALAEVESGRPLTAIYPNGGARTSLGFLVPLERLTRLGIVKRSQDKTEREYTDRQPHGN